MYSLGNRIDSAVLECSKSATGMSYLKGILATLRAKGNVWFVDTNTGNDSDAGDSLGQAFVTMDQAFDSLSSGDSIMFRGNPTEHLTSPLGANDVTIVGLGTRPRHSDTHPMDGELSGSTWRASAANPLLTLRSPGWHLENFVMVANAAEYAIELNRTGDEDDTEEDASHAEIVGVRFGSGAGGIHDTGGCFNVLVKDCRFQALTTACILGVGNIGAGQLQWHILNNHFSNFTNGVKIAAHECVIKGNYFTDGGTPNTTYVLNTNNGGGRDNFVVENYFQTLTANFNTPDVVGCATDVWNNTSIDGTATFIGREVGQPA